MRSFIKKITHPFLKLGLNIFYSKPRKYTYDGIEILVHPDVFPPHLTLSTKILLDFLSKKELKIKKILELGCGSGIISIYSTKKGALVTASDINQTALEYLKKNAEKHQSTINIIYSNLFDDIKKSDFDYIIINPPYYPKKPDSMKENAWFCGENFEYFKKLFNQLPLKTSINTEVIMILSEDCDIKKIKSLASNNGLILSVVHKKKVMKEMNYIFKINRNF